MIGSRAHLPTDEFRPFRPSDKEARHGGLMTLATGTTAAPRAGRREWIGLAVIALPCLLYAMDLTVLHLAVPRQRRDAYRGQGPARGGRGHPGPLDPVADLQHVPGPAAAEDRDRRLGGQLLGRRGHRPPARRGPSRVLLVGLGVPALGAGDADPAGGRPEAAPRVPGPGRGASRPHQRGDV